MWTGSGLATIRPESRAGRPVCVSLNELYTCPFQPGDKLGPYEIFWPLGAGGMREAWKDRDTRIDRIVAIKISRKTSPNAVREKREPLLRMLVSVLEILKHISLLMVRPILNLKSYTRVNIRAISNVEWLLKSTLSPDRSTVYRSQSTKVSSKQMLTGKSL
jgi:hypothetical protein